MRLIDFSDCKIDRHTDYAGSDRKNAIIYNGDRYMIKFSERQEKKNDYATSCVNNVLSEYIGSHIAALAGISTHETILERAYLRVASDNPDDVALNRLGSAVIKDEGSAYDELLRARLDIAMFSHV